MKICVANGDGIGPEIMSSVLGILKTCKVPVQIEIVPTRIETKGRSQDASIPVDTMRAIESSSVLFMAPCTASQGQPNFRALARRNWGAFACKRVFRTLPGIPSPLRSRKVDLTLITENPEALSDSVEYMPRAGVSQLRRTLTLQNSDRIHRYAMETAEFKSIRRITCAHDDEYMAMSDGLFLKAFYEAARNFPNLEVSDLPVSELASLLIADPSRFELIVAPSLQAQALTGLLAGMIGGLSYVPSASIGSQLAIFDVAHGPTEHQVNRDEANPSALLLSATMMLRYVGLSQYAVHIEAALMKTLSRMNQVPDLGQPVPPFSRTMFDTQINHFLQDGLDELSQRSHREFVQNAFHKSVV